MGRPKRIRRRLTLNVTERPPANPDDRWTPGARFAHGWSRYFFSQLAHHEAVKEFGGDAIQLAGYLAAKAAWDAHFHAVNWMELQP